MFLIAEHRAKGWQLSKWHLKELAREGIWMISYPEPQRSVSSNTIRHCSHCFSPEEYVWGA